MKEAASPPKSAMSTPATRQERSIVERGLVERHARPKDRRSHALRLTQAGRAQLEVLGRIAREHQDDLCASLSAAERDQLRDLLLKIATRCSQRPTIIATNLDYPE
jgi:DNA-binding MarR family transcriptional regulator